MYDWSFVRRRSLLAGPAVREYWLLCRNQTRLVPIGEPENPETAKRGPGDAWSLVSEFGVRR